MMSWKYKDKKTLAQSEQESQMKIKEKRLSKNVDLHKFSFEEKKFFLWVKKNYSRLGKMREGTP